MRKVTALEGRCCFVEDLERLFLLGMRNTPLLCGEKFLWGCGL
jgi:hypothetical protein